MPHAHTSTVDSDITEFTSSVPPPPYSGPDVTNLNVLPQAFTRPALPEHKRNQQLSNCGCPGYLRADLAVPEETYFVKFQTIVREGKEIVVGRIKVPTVSVSCSTSWFRRHHVRQKLIFIRSREHTLTLSYYDGSTPTLSRSLQCSRSPILALLTSRRHARWNGYVAGRTENLDDDSCHG